MSLNTLQSVFELHVENPDPVWIHCVTSTLSYYEIYFYNAQYEGWLISSWSKAEGVSFRKASTFIFMLLHSHTQSSSCDLQKVVHSSDDLIVTVKMATSELPLHLGEEFKFLDGHGDGHHSHVSLFNSFAILERRSERLWPEQGAAAVWGQTHRSVLFTGQRSVWILLNHKLYRNIRGTCASSLRCIII